jgi:hypothetical protein
MVRALVIAIHGSHGVAPAASGFRNNRNQGRPEQWIPRCFSAVIPDAFGKACETFKV